KSTDQAFAEVAANTSRVGGLVDEIAAASNEQALGIEQLNAAVSEIDQATQQNVANADLLASNAGAFKIRDAGPSRCTNDQESGDGTVLDPFSSAELAAF
ncbi:MAG: methyl-accepting chemotaxis protein, partial [Deltaproteobacteria bacterium]|nr:methyl-accepting chemotaxis protein [Deltaproteobacteria bacterium]